MTLARERRVRGVMKAQRRVQKYAKVRSVCEIQSQAEMTVGAMDRQTTSTSPFYTEMGQR